MVIGMNSKTNMQEIATIEIDRQDVSLTAIAEMDREEQVGVMREWFFENYEDPVERTPYESREGGYIYIWGGPYYAPDELTVFSGYVPDDVIESLGEELSSICFDWTGASKPEDYQDIYIDTILCSNEYFDSFDNCIAHVREILQTNIDGAARDHLLGLLFVNVITAIETYLSDAFINTVLNNKMFLRKFVENCPEFNKRTFILSDLFKKHESIKTEVQDYLLAQMWHNIKKVKPMYKSTLDVDFPNNLREIFLSIKIRHDLVHRNGKDKDGEVVNIRSEDVAKLIDEASSFINHINEQLDSFDGSV